MMNLMVHTANWPEVNGIFTYIGVKDWLQNVYELLCCQSDTHTTYSHRWDACEVLKFTWLGLYVPDLEEQLTYVTKLMSIPHWPEWGNSHI